MPLSRHRRSTTMTTLPFGLTQALPVEAPAARTWLGALSYCPEQQLTVVTRTGTPFIDSPSMASEIQTVTQTRHDSQIFDDNGGTDKD
ncbi:hypothetical protein ADL27_43405 [Streptomyces sp. NRRL F-6602]|nr:hypothetical protein ADL27_43405 [Streptomyces sp. NRRL F-6602]